MSADIKLVLQDQTSSVLAINVSDRGPAGGQGEQGDQGDDGQGVPTGGDAGQVLAKIDGVDFNSEWIEPPSGGSSYDQDLNTTDNVQFVSLNVQDETNPTELTVHNTFTDASNYERGFMRWSANVLEIGAEADGTGVVRETALTSGVVNVGNGSQAYLKFNTTSTGRIYVGSALLWRMSSAVVDFYKPFRPYINGGVTCGLDAQRWSTTYTQDLDASGTVKAANLNLSNLPTSDPLVSGDVWNDGGTLKISAG